MKIKTQVLQHTQCTHTVLIHMRLDTPYCPSPCVLEGMVKGQCFEVTTLSHHFWSILPNVVADERSQCLINLFNGLTEQLLSDSRIKHLISIQLQWL